MDDEWLRTRRSRGGRSRVRGHRIVHGYEKVDAGVIRGIIEDRLPLLLRQFEALLERPEP